MADAEAEAAGSSEVHSSMSNTAPTEQEPAPPPAKKPKVAKPPEPPWKTFEAAELPRGGRQRKAPATFVAGPASGKRVDLNEGPGAQTRGDKAPQEEKANGSSQYDKAAVGKRVEVYWDGNDKWFKGEVKDYAPTTQKHLVKYEDNDTQWLILAQEEQPGQPRRDDSPDGALRVLGARGRRADDAEEDRGHDRAGRHIRRGADERVAPFWGRLTWFECRCQTREARRGDGPDHAVLRHSHGGGGEILPTLCGHVYVD